MLIAINTPNRITQLGVFMSTPSKTASRTYRFSHDLATKLKETARTFTISESDLVRMILETGIEIMEKK
jgi:hypothetical protein